MMIFLELFDWGYLGTCAGAMFAVAVLTQITKEIPGIRRIPTQLWSYVLALLVLILAEGFGGGLTAPKAVLALFNAAIVSLAANGGYAMVERMKPDRTEPPEDHPET